MGMSGKSNYHFITPTFVLRFLAMSFASKNVLSDIKFPAYGEDEGVAWTLQKLSSVLNVNPYPTAFPYGNGMVLHFYQQQESSTTKTVHKVINKGLKTYV